MKIVVTGSLGNISKPLTKELVQKGHAVTVISSKAEKRKEIEALGATAAIGSLEDADFLSATFTGSDAVYCMLPPFDFFNPKLDFMAEARKLANNYAKAIQSSGVKQVVHLSSVGAHVEKGNGAIDFHFMVEHILRELPSDVAITHIRPVAFQNNLYAFTDFVKGKGFLEGFIGKILTLQHYGLISLIKGNKKGIILSNYGAKDIIPWVSPKDIASAITEELVTPFVGRKVRYIASEELTCNEVAGILGTAVEKPYLKWVMTTDKQMLSALKGMGLPLNLAQSLVDMNASMHTAKLFEDYYKNKPTLGKVKMKDFAKEFATAYNQ